MSEIIHRFMHDSERGLKHLLVKVIGEYGEVIRRVRIYVDGEVRVE